MINTIFTRAMRVYCSVVLLERHPVLAYLYSDGSDMMNSRSFP